MKIINITLDHAVRSPLYSPLTLRDARSVKSICPSCFMVRSSVPPPPAGRVERDVFTYKQSKVDRKKTETIWGEEGRSEDEQDKGAGGGRAAVDNVSALFLAY